MLTLPMLEVSLQASFFSSCGGTGGGWSLRAGQYTPCGPRIIPGVTEVELRAPGVVGFRGPVVAMAVSSTPESNPVADSALRPTTGDGRGDLLRGKKIQQITFFIIE